MKKLNLSMMLLATTASLSVHAKSLQVCGTLKASVNVETGAEYSVVAKNGTQVAIYSNSAETDQKLEDLTKPLFVPFNPAAPAPERDSQVCISGTVVLNDEAKGLAISVTSSDQIVEAE